MKMKSESEVPQSCLTLSDPWTAAHQALRPWDFPGKSTGVGCHCLLRRNKRYAVEVKTSKNFAGEKSYAQLAGYLDKLGLPEGWMAIFDEDKAKPWDEKLFTRDVELNGKTLHLIGL